MTNTKATPNNGYPQGIVSLVLAGGLEGTQNPSSCTPVQIGSTLAASCSIAFTPNVAASAGKVKAHFNATSQKWDTGNSDTDFALTVTAPSCTETAVATDPTNQIVTYGAATVSFTASASGNPTPTVQWEVDAAGGSVIWLHSA